LILLPVSATSPAPVPSIRWPVMSKRDRPIVDGMLMREPSSGSGARFLKQKAPQTGLFEVRLARLERATFGFVGMLPA
jgi:hypothetical protein